MGFGITHFKKIKEEAKKQVQEKFYKVIIVGDDISCFLSFLELRKSYNAEEMKFIISNEVSRQTLLERFQTSLHDIRNDESAQILKRYFPEIKLEKNEGQPVFYKDTEFKPFGGRTKNPSPLLGDEAYFVSDFYRYNIEQVINSIGLSLNDWENLDQLLSPYREDKELLTIEKTSPSDLIDTEHWILKTKDDFIINCKNLIWGRGPKSFLKVLASKDSLPESLVQSIEDIKTTPGYLVNFELNKKIIEENQTFFLPQSLTHDWGHFIGESLENESDKQSLSFVGQVHEEEITSEDLAKKIKLLKRTLKRVFENFGNEEAKHIYFSEEMFVGEIEDKSLCQYLEKEFPFLTFVGKSAPLKIEEVQSSQTSSLGYIARSLLSFNELRKNQTLF